MRHNVKTQSETEIVEALRERIDYHTTQDAIAKELGISRSYLCEVLGKKKKVGPVILKALGYDPTPHYRKVKP